MVEVLAEGFDAVAAARRVKLVCLDLDGTLLDPMKQVPAGNRAAIERARAAGLHVAIASGRHPFNICELLDDLGMPHDAVCLSGAYTMLDGREVGRHGLDDATVGRVIDVVERYGCYVSLAGADFNLTSGNVDRGPGGKTAAVSRYVDCDGYDDLRARVTEHAGAFLKAATHADDEETYQALRADLRKVPGVSVAQSDKRWSDVVATGCSKAEGIEALARALGFSMHEVAAVGDDENDVESLGAVGLGVAMGNALPEARAAAKVAVADNAHDGVAEAIDFILQAQA